MLHLINDNNSPLQIIGNLGVLRFGLIFLLAAYQGKKIYLFLTRFVSTDYKLISNIINGSIP